MMILLRKGKEGPWEKTGPEQSHQPCPAGRPTGRCRKEFTDVWMLHKLPRRYFKLSEQRARRVGPRAGTGKQREPMKLRERGRVFALKRCSRWSRRCQLWAPETPWPGSKVCPGRKDVLHFQPGQGSRRDKLVKAGRSKLLL